MSGILFYVFDDWARSVSHEKAIKSMKRHNILEIFRCAQNDKTTFCYRRVLQQQVKRSTPTPPPVNWHLPSGRGGI